MRRFTALLSSVLPFKTGGFGYTIMFLQFFYLYQLSASNDIGGVSFSFGSILLILLSMFTAWFFFQLISVFTSKNRIFHHLSLLLGLTFYDLLLAYQFGSQEPANWSFIAGNADLLFSWEAVVTVFSTFDEGALNYLLPLYSIFLFCEWRRNTLSNNIQVAPRRKKAIYGSLLYLFLLFIPIDSYDPMLNFFRTIKQYYMSPFTMNITLQKATYPFMHSRVFNTQKFEHKAPSPNIILIVAESLNAPYIDKKSSDGIPYAPFLSSLKSRSVYVPRFYGNSIQTAKGHFATYFSSIPCLTGKTFVNYPDTALQSIADILNQHHYRSVYFNAHRKPNFDNTSPFLSKRGYEFFILEPYLTEENKRQKSTWGVIDSIFFKRFFDFYAQELKNSDKPFFATLATIHNHFPFNISEDKRQVYPDPSSFQERYANSLRILDQGIETFFTELNKRPELANTIVIITGDHGFPLGEHGNFNLESGYHEESFRVPLYIVWNEHLKPQHIERPSSQLDIAPTILDLLNIDPSTSHFAGHSIFSQNTHPIPLIQPYVKHLSVVIHPIKYRYNTRLDKEYAYNLDVDPMETTNIFSSLSSQQRVLFRTELERIYRNDLAIKSNQIWKNNLPK